MFNPFKISMFPPPKPMPPLTMDTVRRAVDAIEGQAQDRIEREARGEAPLRIVTSETWSAYMRGELTKDDVMARSWPAE